MKASNDEKTNANLTAYLKYVVFNKNTWTVSLFCGFIFMPVQVIGEVWGVMFLEKSYEFNETDSSLCTSFLFLGCFVGGPIAIALSSYLGKCLTMRIGAILTFIFLSILVGNYNLGVAETVGVCFIIGAGSSTLAVSYVMAGSLFSEKYAGLSFAIANMMTIVIGMLVQQIVGILLDVSWHLNGELTLGNVPQYSANDFTVAMSGLPIVAFLTIILTYYVPDYDSKA